MTHFKHPHVWRQEADASTKNNVMRRGSALAISVTLLILRRGSALLMFVFWFFFI